MLKSVPAVLLADLLDIALGNYFLFEISTTCPASKVLCNSTAKE